MPDRLEQIAKLRAPIDFAEEQPNSLIALRRSFDMTAQEMPLSADSINMNVQYFSSDESDQNSQTQSQSIQRFISEEFSFLGRGKSEQASKAAASRINSQYSRHNIAGTLVLSAPTTLLTAATITAAQGYSESTRPTPCLTR